jgi:hypothetical protein
VSDEVTQTIGVDWSGAGPVSAQRAAIWLAVVRDGVLCELTPGLSRAEATRRAIDLAGLHPRTLLGLDFAFSLPRWWMERQGFAAAEDVWRWAAEQAADDDLGWLRGLPAPFWGVRFRPKPTDVFGPEQPELRRTEAESTAPGAIPKSTFRLFGPGTVGAQSLRGHPCLLVLRDSGFSIWPFEPPVWPLAVEVFPRLLVGQVAPGLAHLKGAALRAAAVDAAPPGLTGPAGVQASLLAANQDAFDAAVSAWALWLGRGALIDLPAEEHVKDYRLEGRIWRLPSALTPSARRRARRLAPASTDEAASRPHP